ncbi:unnamed protein product [marine sediment metagenome]|uniref:Uncharacterized protein n=1 Tax=marine sediment metagenome TaxID=412755 RepID=X1RH81_9ZZZZ
MDDKLRRQLEKILEKAEAIDRARTLEFFEKARSIEPPSEEERRWLLEQFRILAKVVMWSEEDKKEANMVLTLNLFAMGRAYERYHIQKKSYNGRG